MGPISDPVKSKLLQVFEGLFLKAVVSTRVLVVSGKKTARALGLTELLKTSLIPQDVVRVWEYSDSFVTDFEAQEVCEIVRSFQPDVIVGLGGGVAMDLAKIASAESAIGSAPLTSQSPADWMTKRPFQVPLVLIPTLFGSGAEATFHSVIYRNREKHSMVFQPSTIMSSVLIPELAHSASRESRLFAALDAVCQGVETSWSKGATELSRQLAIDGLGGVILGFDDYVRGLDTNATDMFVKGANEIGQAMNTGKTTAPHALSYFLTSHAGLSHGYAVAILLLYFWRDIMNFDRGEGFNGYREVISKISGIPKSVLGKPVEFELWLEEIFSEYRLESNLSNLLKAWNLSEVDFLSAANVERLSNHPVALDDKDLRRILEL
jgi:alcohol dehydrogenase class IV